MGKVAAIVLAAGEASRFGSPKQHLLLPAVLERLGRTAIDEIVVVQGAHRLESPSNSLLQGIPARVVHCKEWELGPGASLRCGLSVLGEDIDAAVVVLADGPNLAPATVERVLETNYLGGVWCSRAFLPGLRAAAASGGSHVVNVVSIAGTVAFAPAGPYAAAKHAQLAFSRSLAATLRAEGRRRRAPPRPRAG